MAPSNDRVLPQLLRVCAWSFFLTLPLAHAFAITTWVTIPNVFALLCLLSAPVIWRTPMQWTARDGALLAVVALALVATLTNPHLQTDKSQNHVLAVMFVVLLNYFVATRYGLVASGERWRSAVCVGVVGAGLLCIVEYVLVNVAQISFDLPRPSVADYEPTFIFGTRARATFSESGHFAFFLATMGPIALTALKEEGRTLALGATTVVLLVSAVLAFSTTLFIVLVLWLLLYAATQIARPRLVGLAVTIAFCGVALYLTAFDVVADVFHAAFVGKFATGSYTGRLVTIASNASVIAGASDMEILFGHGMGSYAGLHIAPAISAYVNFARDIGILGCLLIVLVMLPYESLLARVPLKWRLCFVYVAVANVTFLAAIPDYYFPHFAFVLGLMSHMGVQGRQGAHQ